MPLLIAIVLALVSFLVIWLRLIPPPHAVTLIRISNGSLDLRRGRLKSFARENVEEIRRESDIQSGFIDITSNNRVTFSRHIPAKVHQRLRNVLLNQ